MLSRAKAWLAAAPTDRPADLKDFKESQKRLYEQSARVVMCSSELARLTSQLKATTKALQSRSKDKA